MRNGCEHLLRVRPHELGEGCRLTSLVYSTVSRFSSPICSVYSTATLWSIGPLSSTHGPKMSVFTRSLAFHVFGGESRAQAGGWKAPAPACECSRLREFEPDRYLTKYTILAL